MNTRKFLLSALCVGSAAIGLAVAANVDATGNTNTVEFWCPSGGVKYEPVSTPFIVPPPDPDTIWTLLVLKAGSGADANASFPFPTVGGAYSHPNGHDNSHAILCREPLPDDTTTTEPESDPTEPETTEATTSTPTTIPETTEPVETPPPTEPSTTISDSTLPDTTEPATTSPSTDPSTTEPSTSSSDVTTSTSSPESSTSSPPTTEPSTSSEPPATSSTEPERLDITAISPVCLNDAPYIDVTFGDQPEFDGQLAAVTYIASNGTVGGIGTVTFQSNTTVRFVYPGATVDASGNPTDWPGWVFDGDEWVVDPTDSFLRDGLTVVVEVNPITTGEVTYPPATPACDPNPPTNSPSPSTDPPTLLPVTR